MNIITLLLNQSRRERGYQRSKSCLSVGFFTLLVFLISLTAIAEDTKTEEPSSTTSGVETQTTADTAQNANATEENSATTQTSSATIQTTKEQITGTSVRMERYEKEGITILIGEAKTVRSNEQGVEIGFLNADKITLKSDTETDQTIEIVAEGNVEIRDQNIFATCDHAIMNNLTNIITLKENVVVLQNKDRLETKLFTFNRTTGKQTGEGGVKFKVTVTQAAPIPTEADENAETGTGTGETETSTTEPETTQEPAQKENGAENSADEKSEADTEDTTDGQSEADAGDTETPADSNGETETETPDDTDANAETEETETN